MKAKRKHKNCKYGSCLNYNPADQSCEYETKEGQEKKRKRLKAKCWELKSKIVRYESINPKTGLCVCFTCDREYPFKKMNAGHLYHNCPEILDYDKYHIQAQCFRCNHELSGNLGIFERRIQERFGRDHADRLFQLNFSLAGTKLSIDDLERIKNVLSQRLKEITGESS